MWPYNFVSEPVALHCCVGTYSAWLVALKLWPHSLSSSNSLYWSCSPYLLICCRMFSTFAMFANFNTYFAFAMLVYSTMFTDVAMLFTLPTFDMRHLLFAHLLESLWTISGPPGELLGPLGALSGASWEPLGASWRPLGGPLEAYWRPLGLSWTPLRALERI